MAYYIANDQDPASEVARIVREQLRLISRVAVHADTPVGERVHAVRLHCKRLRACMQLLPDNAASRTIQSWVRAVARELSLARDAHAAHACALELAPELATDATAAATAQWLTDTLQRAEARAAGTLGALEPGVAELLPTLSGSDWAGVDTQMITEKLQRNVRREARARRRAARAGTSRYYHRWRKRCKMLSLQVRLMRELTDAETLAMREQWQLLGRLLGREHDCTVLRERLRLAPAAVRADAKQLRLRKRAGQRRHDLREKALAFASAISADQQA